MSYENCASPAAGRQPLTTHPDVPNLAACATVNGKGITLLDLRMPLPLDFIFDVSFILFPFLLRELNRTEIINQLKILI